MKEELSQGNFVVHPLAYAEHFFVIILYLCAVNNYVFLHSSYLKHWKNAAT